MILGLLTALNLVNYIDRFLVMAVGPRFQKEFGISNAELGTLETAFMLGYMLTSPIFGRLGDRYARKQLIAVGVALWSIATVVSGMTHGFWSMFAARVAVGVGEASYATLSPTIIDDLADRETKNRDLAIFYVAIPVGAALGYVLGGILDPLYGWRAAFKIAGGPGVALAGLMLLIAEPARKLDAASDARAQSSAVYRELLGNARYRGAVLGYVAQTFALGGFSAWAAPFLCRHLDFALESGNKIFGYITVGTGLVGTAVGGALADRLAGEDRTRVALRVCAWSSAIAAPIALIALLASSPAGFLIGLAAAELAIFTSVSPSNAAVLGSVRPETRASAMAASIFAIHLLGDLISAPVIGKVSDHFHDAEDCGLDARGLEMGMMLLPIALALSAFFWFNGARMKSPLEARR